MEARDPRVVQVQHADVVASPRQSPGADPDGQTGATRLDTQRRGDRSCRAIQTAPRPVGAVIDGNWLLVPGPLRSHASPARAYGGEFPFATGQPATLAARRPSTMFVNKQGSEMESDCKMLGARRPGHQA